MARHMKQISSAVKYLHDNEIAHRDIKPENIVLTNVIICFLFRVYARFVILDGQLFVTIGDAHAVVLLITHLHKYLKESSMIILWIFGVWESSHINY